MSVEKKVEDSRFLVTNLIELFRRELDTSIRLIETHISWVILTGTKAYKIKKPLDFEFLNFVDLEQRKFYCEAEVRLNKRLAKQFYLNVVPITGSRAEPQLNGKGEILEYAIEMVEFPQQELLLSYLESGKLKYEHIEATAKALAEFHTSLAPDYTSSYGTAEQVHEPVLQNIEQILPFILDEKDQIDLNVQEKWVNHYYQKLYPQLKERKAHGWIRECHGDCHLGNIIWHEGQPILFDCIEFNEAFRFTDIMADVAFCMMDLFDHGYEHYAWRFLNSYLEVLPDYQGLEVLPYYFAYRAMVRAKIALFERLSAASDKKRQQELYHHFQHLLQLANRFTHATKPHLVITHGCSGSGKTFLAKEWSAQNGAIHLRSDIIRKRLSYINPLESAKSEYLQGIYSPDITEKVYQNLYEQAEQLLALGYSVVVDASFLKCAHREKFYQLGEQFGTLTHLLVPQASYEEMVARLAERKNRDASDADEEILRAQRKNKEELSGNELERQLDKN